MFAGPFVHAAGPPDEHERKRLQLKEEEVKELRRANDVIRDELACVHGTRQTGETAVALTSHRLGWCLTLGRSRWARWSQLVGP